jgi:hypothetical protein
MACSSTLTQISPTQPAGQPTGRVGTFLNSAFFLTVVAGVTATGITGGYSYLKANSDKKLAEDNARREKQNAVLSAVANDLPIYTSTLGSMKELKVWLADNKDNDATFGSIGLPRDEVLKEYLEFYKLSLKARTAISILTEVRSFYGETPVCNAVNEEESAIKRIEAAKHYPEVEAAGKAEGMVFDVLLGAMAEEIRRPPKKAADLGTPPCRRLPQVVVAPSKN